MSTIILDRDGVINFDSDAYIKSPEEWHAIPGSLEAIAQLNRAGFTVFVATNQSGIARRLYDVEMLDRIHERMITELAAVGGYIEEVFFCPHHPDDHCVCRKPNPGLLYRIANKYGVELSKAYFVGDTRTDMLAAQAAGCLPILILSAKGQKDAAAHPELLDIPHFANLATAVDFILRKS